MEKKDLSGQGLAMEENSMVANMHDFGACDVPQRPVDLPSALMVDPYSVPWTLGTSWWTS
jgi:hypothetical protein